MNAVPHDICPAPGLSARIGCELDCLGLAPQREASGALAALAGGPPPPRSAACTPALSFSNRGARLRIAWRRDRPRGWRRGDRDEPCRAVDARMAFRHRARDPAERGARGRALAGPCRAGRRRPGARRRHEPERPLPVAQDRRSDRGQCDLWRPNVFAGQLGRGARMRDLERQRRIGGTGGRIYPGGLGPGLEARRSAAPAAQ